MLRLLPFIALACATPSGDDSGVVVDTEQEPSDPPTSHPCDNVDPEIDVVGESLGGTLGGAGELGGAGGING